MLQNDYLQENTRYFRRDIYIAFKQWKHDAKLNQPPVRRSYGLCSYMIENHCPANPFRKQWKSEYGNTTLPFGNDVHNATAYHNKKRIKFVDDYIEAYEKFSGIKEHG